MSNIGDSSGWPAICVSRAEASFTPASVAMPMSARRAAHVEGDQAPPPDERARPAAPPRTPAAGPDSMSVTGRSAASRDARDAAVGAHDEDLARRRPRGAAPPPGARGTRRCPGPTKAFMAAVVKRSNSRNCGVMSADVQTKQPGQLLAQDLRRALLVRRVEVGEQEADGDRPRRPASRRARARPRARRPRRARAMTSPVGGAMRSGTVRRYWRWTNGRSATGCPA